MLTPIVCGLEPDGTEPLTVWAEAEEWEAPRCEERLYRTHRPASTLWCPVHGHVVDAPPPAPLTGTVILTFADGCTLADLEDLASA